MAAEAVRDYSDTALMLYGVRLGGISFLLLGTKLPSRVSGAPRHHSRYAAQTNILRFRIKFPLLVHSFRQYIVPTL